MIGNTTRGQTGGPWLLALFAALTASLFPPAAARADITSILTAVPQGDTTIYDLTITSVKPDARAIEHSPITVDFKLTLTLGRDDPGPQHIRICPEDFADIGDSCTDIKAARVGRSYTRTLQTFAPAAAASPGAVRLVAYIIPKSVRPVLGKTRRTVARAATPYASAAEYRVEVVGFAPLRTRAVQADTVRISLQAKVEGQRSAADDACNVIEPAGPGSGYCAKLIKIGDTPENSRGTRVSTVGVGPYVLVPEADPDLVFSYQIVNMGQTYEQKVFVELMNGISDAAQAFLSAYGKAGGNWDDAHDLTNKINGLAWAGCDGPVAVDARSAVNKSVERHFESTLLVRTEATGYWEQQEPSIGDFADRSYYEYASQDGCGRSSKYQVVWRITRTSWQAPPPK